MIYLILTYQSDNDSKDYNAQDAAYFERKKHSEQLKASKQNVFDSKEGIKIDRKKSKSSSSFQSGNDDYSSSPYVT